ncbi:hypothetical protein B0O99DRAFT_689564 [Bisporella sp. PMI_857]|nr:hypothetical protein B0O99DRAFT_689564 [Bisporella sp. PMI_857]
MTGLVLIAAGTYLAEAIKLAVEYILVYASVATQDRIVGQSIYNATRKTSLPTSPFYLIASTATFAVEALSLADTKLPVWYPYYVTWILGILVELTLLVTSYVLQTPRTPFDFFGLVIQLLRVATFIALPTLYFGLRSDKTYDNSDPERQTLLKKRFLTKQSSDEGYGTASQESVSADKTNDLTSQDSYLAREQKAKDLISKRLQQDGNWFTYAKAFTIFFPYVWPFRNKTLQFRAFLVGICLLAGNALNVLVPRQMGNMVDSLDGYMRSQDGDPELPVPNIWIPALVYAGLLFISGEACIGWLRRWLWLPVEQYSYEALNTASHAHLMKLSSDFHDEKTSSDLTQAVSGGRSVANLLETVLFEVVPMFIDLAIAFAFLSWLFGPLMSMLLAVEAMVYFYTTTKLIARRAEKRRDYIAFFRKEWTVGQQSLDGWTTASLFNQIPYERDRYSTGELFPQDSSVKNHMNTYGNYQLSQQSISAMQGGVISVGLLAALFLGVWQVAYENKSIGNLTTLLLYWAKLQSPLIFFSNMYRTISHSLMDAERLLELFQTKPTVTDAPNATELKLKEGHVAFKNVSFAYDERKPTLKDVSFAIPAGKTVALVGETGGGKSTILKLIDRFYDVKTGRITIDGQDIRNITLESLRAHIGVVPQDPMLFNDTIINNIRYARLTASDQEVHEACQAAAIHDKIMSFPDGYDSKVGDRGVKLSGGEKQRVAIARAILKRPEIILLDEATSAVDTETESQIQEAFGTLCRGRTTFIVAQVEVSKCFIKLLLTNYRHRLSTIMRADRILVVMNGEIIEQGSHSELLHAEGRYAALWSKQINVKPDNEQGEPKSSEKRDGDLINDLSTNQGTTTLAKAIEATRHAEHPSETQTSETQTAGKDDKFYQAGGHKNEISTLKPDAPEFVPHSKDENLKPSTKSDSKTAAKTQKTLERERKVSIKVYRKGKGKGGADELTARNDSQSKGGFRDPSIRNDSAILHRGKLKYPSRPTRRHQAKSEPSNIWHEILDGSHYSDSAIINSEDSQPRKISIIQSRRVSAPNDPPSRQGSRRGGKRARKFRLKSRSREYSDSRVSSKSDATERSSDLANLPTGSPLVSDQPVAKSEGSSIRFAPGF